MIRIGVAFKRWMNVWAYLPDDFGLAGQGWPKFYGLEGALSFPAGLSALAALFPIAWALGVWVGLFPYPPNGMDYTKLAFMTFGCLGFSALLVQTVHILAARKITEEQYRWALECHPRLGMEEPKRCMTKAMLVPYVEAAYRNECERRNDSPNNL